MPTPKRAGDCDGRDLVGWPAGAGLGCAGAAAGRVARTAAKVRARRGLSPKLASRRATRRIAEPVCELTRCAAREGPESVQAPQLGKMLVPGLGPHRVVGEVVPVQVELASDEIHDGRRHELARSQQATRVAEHAQLQREAQLCCRGRRRAPMFCRSSSLRV